MEDILSQLNELSAVRVRDPIGLLNEVISRLESNSKAMANPVIRSILAIFKNAIAKMDITEIDRIFVDVAALLKKYGYM